MAISLGVLASTKSSNLSTGFSSIATVTAAGGETSLTFSSIPQTYTDLQIRGISKDTNTALNSANGVAFQFNADTGANYAYHLLISNGSAVSASGSASQTSIVLDAGSVYSNAAETNMFGVNIIDISDYTSATKNKTLRAVSGGDTNAANTNIHLDVASGVWLSTSAITSIKIIPNNTFAAGTTFALYGIKAAA